MVRIATELQDWAAGARVVVCIEQPRPQPINGAISCYSVVEAFAIPKCLHLSLQGKSSLTLAANRGCHTDCGVA